VFDNAWKDLGEFRPFIVRGNTMGTQAVQHRVAIAHQYLRNAPDGKPYFQALAKCQNLIRTIPELVYAENKVEGINKAGEDHAFDAVSVGLMRHVEVMMQSGGVKPELKSKVLFPTFFQDEEGQIQSPDFWQGMRDSMLKMGRSWEHK